MILAWICKNAHDIANFESIDILGRAQCQSNHFQVREILQPQNCHRVARLKRYLTNTSKINLLELVSESLTRIEA